MIRSGGLRLALLVAAQVGLVGAGSVALTAHRSERQAGMPIAPGSLSQPTLGGASTVGWLSVVCDVMATDGQAAMSRGGQDGEPDDQGQGRLPVSRRSQP
jgi:hypothetical protein